MRWCQKRTRSEFRAESSAPVLFTFSHCHPFTIPCAAKHCRFQCFVSLPLVPYSYLLQHKGGVWQRAQAVHLLLHNFRIWGKIVLLYIFFLYIIFFPFSSTVKYFYFFSLPFPPPMSFSFFFFFFISCFPDLSYNLCTAGKSPAESSIQQSRVPVTLIRTETFHIYYISEQTSNTHLF